MSRHLSRAKSRGQIGSRRASSALRRELPSHESRSPTGTPSQYPVPRQQLHAPARRAVASATGHRPGTRRDDPDAAAKAVGLRRAAAMFHVERRRPPKPPSTCRAADRLGRRRAAAVPEPQRRRALLHQTQAVARARDAVRQDRPQPPLRPEPCCDPPLGAEHQSVTLTWSGVSPVRSGRPREAHSVETSTRRRLCGSRFGLSTPARRRP